MTFQAGDVVQDGDYFRLIVGANDKFVFTGGAFSKPENVRSDYDGFCFFFPISQTTHFKLIERDGVPYVEAPWRPENEEKYFTADTISPEKFWVSKWYGNEDDIVRLERGLVFRTKEEAVACADHMLKAVKG